MGHTIAFRDYQRADLERAGHHRQLLAVVILTLISGALSFGVGSIAIDVIRALPAAEASAVEADVVYPAPELSREWSGQRRDVQFEHMYRHPQSPRIDWIRTNGSPYR